MKMLILVAVMLVACCSSFGQSDMLLKHNDKGNYIDHKVQPKENFYSVARLYNIPPKEIAAFNGIEMEKGLNKDQVLHIPLTSANFSQGINAGTPVYVRAGEKDDLKKLSSANKVSVENVRRWNSLTSDKVSQGTRLVVGFFISKEMASQRAIKKDLAIVPEKKTKIEQEPIVKKEDPKPAIKNVDETSSKSPAQGYFKSTFEQQVISFPANKQETLTSGIFKTASGWQDAKYYLLMDGVQPGMVVKVMNPDNNKVVYAKVLGEMSGIRQNDGLNIRISNSAATVLEVPDQEKFTVKVNY
jgi:LysM repeat protein